VPQAVALLLGHVCCFVTCAVGARLLCRSLLVALVACPLGPAVTKSPEEIAEQRKQKEEKEELKRKRKQQQEENVRKKEQ